MGRTMYFNDARHYYLFTFEPPMALADAQRPIVSSLQPRTPSAPPTWGGGGSGVVVGGGKGGSVGGG